MRFINDSLITHAATVADGAQDGSSDDAATVADGAQDGSSDDGAGDMHLPDDDAGDMPELIYLSSDDDEHDSDGGGGGGGGGGVEVTGVTGDDAITLSFVGNTHEDIDGFFAFMAMHMRDLALESHGAPEP